MQGGVGHIFNGGGFNTEHLGYEAGPELTYCFLTPRENLIFGIHRDIRIEKDKDVLRGVNIYAVTTRVAVAFEETGAVVAGVNIAVGG